MRLPIQEMIPVHTVVYMLPTPVTLRDAPSIAKHDKHPLIYVETSVVDGVTIDCFIDAVLELPFGVRRGSAVYDMASDDDCRLVRAAYSLKDPILDAIEPN